MPMAPSEKLYTTHQVAKLVQMDMSSVVKWINDGLLVGYRTPGGHRRIRVSDLLTFLRAHEMYIPPELGEGKRKVLFVDDSQVALSSMRRAMKAFASEVEFLTAQSGLEAMVKVGSLRPQTLVLDMAMPDLDGIEVLTRLKANSVAAPMDVVLLSQKVTPELEKKALALGATAVCAKPISVEELVTLISAH